MTMLTSRATGATTIISDALSGTAGIASFPNAAIPANDVSLAEVIRQIYAALEGTAAGQNGVATWPAAAAAGNNVSIAEVIRYIQETQLGTLTNTGGTATVGGILGDLRALTLGTRVDSMEQSIQKVMTTPSGGADALFTITGGPIKVREMVGIVTTILSGTGNGTLQATTTAPAATVAMSTTVAITDDAAGTSYIFVGPTGVLTPTTAGVVNIDYGSTTVTPTQWVVPIGNINFLSSAAFTGVITWYMSYVPLSPLSRVVAA